MLTIMVTSNGEIPACRESTTNERGMLAETWDEILEMATFEMSKPGWTSVVNGLQSS